MRWFCLCLVAAGAMAQQQPSQGARSAAEPQLCSIEGVVRQADTGEPLRKVLVTALPAGGRAGGAGTAPITPVTASSDAEGRFRLTNLPPGQYRLLAERSGFVRMEYGARRPLQQGSTINVQGGDALKNLEFKLLRQAVVTGRITDEDGDPVQGAQVSLVRYSFVRGRRQLLPAATGASNDLGEYRLFGVAPGKYYLSVTHRGGAFGAMLRNRMPAGGPFGGAGADSSYATMYFPGAYDIDSATLIDVPVAGELQGMDMRLLRTRTYTVRGRVLSQSQRRGGMVMLLPKGAAGFGFGDRLAAPWRPGTGAFEIPGVRPGSYTLIAQVFEDRVRMSARMPVEVGEGDVNDLTITPVSGGNLSGVFRLQDGASGSFRVQLNPRETMGPFGGGMGEAVAPGADGKFVIENVAPGVYDVTVSGLSDNNYVKAIRYGQVDALAHGLDLTNGVAGAIEILISPNGAAISGSVSDADGNPKPGVTVLLVPAADRSRIDLYKSATADQSASYRFAGVAPGDYLLLAIEDHERGAEFDPRYIEQFSQQVVKVSVREGASETKPLRVVAAPN
jgi:hypothetical protein